MNRRLDPDTRRDELLEAASDLFLENGYRDTSVNSIVESIGVSKGTFYYYFDSKEDVLDGLVEKISNPIYDKIDEIVGRNSLTAIEKLNKIFAASRQTKLA
ncbi:MAG: TetR/AcrR family transcriptional regulator [Candidatus Bipolaricaulota bacterium]